MVHIRKIFLALLVGCSCLILAKGQSTIPATGGTATGSGGSVSYTVGQVAWNNYSGINGSLNQGVQQPWEISTPVAIENTEDISLLMNVYPNPTSGAFKLIVGTLENRNLRVRLYDINGILIQDNKIYNEETEIFLKNYSSSIYFLKVINNNQEVKVFKVVKN